MNISRVILFVSALVFILALTGCTGAREIDEWSYIYTMGVDKGISGNIRMTVQIATLKGPGSGARGQGGGQGGSEGNNFTVYTLDCPTFYAGVDMINSALSRKLNYAQAKYFICSEELAQEDIGTLMSAFVRDRQIRRTMHMIVVRGQASDFIKALNPVVGSSMSKTQEGMMSMKQVTGLLFDNSLGNFLDEIKSTKAQPICALAAVNDFSSFNKTGGSSAGAFKASSMKSPGEYYAGELPREGGNATEYIGTALFDGGKFVGELNGDETRCLLMAKGEYGEGAYAVPAPLEANGLITVNVRQERKPETKVTFKDEKAYIDLKVYLDGDIMAIRSDTDYESPELKPVLEAEIQKMIKNQFDETIKKCQGLDCDAFGFGETACMQFPTIQEWESYQWLSRFKDAVIKAEVKFTIRRTGTMIKTNPVKSGGG